MRSINQVLSKRAAAEKKSEEYSEKRFAPRRKDSATGIVYLGSGTGSFPCMVRDMSTTGAQLELRAGWDNPFSSGVSLNDKIRLVVRMHRVVYDCKIVRRGERVLGVKFTAPPRAMSVADAKSSAVTLGKGGKVDAAMLEKAMAARSATKTPRS